MDWVRTLGTFEEPRPPAERSEPFPDENMGVPPAPVTGMDAPSLSNGVKGL